VLAQSHGDSAAVAAVVERFHRALEEGDSVAALAQLAEDAVILESSSIESRDEYRSHHLSADIAFARAVKGTRSPGRMVVRGDVAWTTGTSTTRGKFRGKSVNSTGAELMVLTRSRDGWKINAIHWSSRSQD
jgi:ketosteroid isomerase-like protein